MGLHPMLGSPPIDSFEAPNHNRLCAPAEVNAEHCRAPWCARLDTSFCLWPSDVLF
jgi:hypothetical protein